MTTPTPAAAYMLAATDILNRISATQLDNIERAADICAHTIGARGLVHLFATGHSRMFIEEMFPRHGSFPGFHPLVELSLTFHNVVVGANGQRQAMFLEHVEGFSEVILRNFVLSAPDSFIIFSNSGVNEVVVDMALGAKKRGLPVIAVVSMDHCSKSAAKHSSGLRLPEIADVTIDSCAPAGDAMVMIENLTDPVGPGSTVAMAAVTNALKCAIADKLTRMGKPPIVLSSGLVIGAEASKRRFDECYDDYRDRVKRVYGA